MPRFAPIAWATVTLLALSACTAAPGTVPGATPTTGNSSIPGHGGLLGNTSGSSTLGGGVAGGTAANGQAIATGPDGSQLTRDNALALVEATDFVLNKLGKGSPFAAQKEQAIQALANAWPSMDASSRQKMVNARAQANLAMQNWDALGGDDQLAFARDVLTLSVGQQSANQLLAQFSGGAGSGGGESNGGGDSWAAEAADKCKNGSYEDQLFYCHGVISPGAPSAN